MPHILGYDFSRVELERRVGDLSQEFGVDLAELKDGLERGIRILRFRSGSGLEFQVLVDRAFDIADMTFRGIPIGWKSAAGFRSPWLHEMSAEGRAGPGADRFLASWGVPGHRHDYPTPRSYLCSPNYELKIEPFMPAA